jgi:hypothetical protein
MPAPRKAKKAKKSAGFPRRDLAAIKPAPGLKVSKKKFSGLDLEAAFTVLLSPKSFYGHKSLVFAGLKGWLLGSHNLVSSRHAIASAVSDRIAKAEKLKPGSGTTMSAFVRVNRKYSPFFEQVYDHIGGMAAIRKALLNAAKMDDSRRLARKQIPHLVAIASILDFHARELASDPKTFGVPNIIKAGSAAHWLMDPDKSKKLGDATIWEYWRAHARALPLLYSASLIQLETGETLLERLLANKLSLKEASPTFELWFSHAKHFSDHVISHLKLRNKKGKKDAPSEKTHKASRFPQMSCVRAEEPPAPLFSDVLKINIADHFAKKKNSEKVVRHA